MTVRNSIATGAALLVLAATPTLAQDAKVSSPAAPVTKQAIPAYDFAAAQASAAKAVKGSILGMRLGRLNSKDVIFIRMKTADGNARVIVDAATGNVVATDTNLTSWKDSRRKRGWGWRHHRGDDGSWCRKGSRGGKGGWFDSWR